MKLYQKWMTTGNVQDELVYKNYRKVYKKVFDEDEQNYYYQQFDLKSNSMKQVWSNLNDIASLSKIKGKTCISSILADGVEYTTPKDISNCLNNYFCSIGPKLAETINCHTTELLQYCHASVKDSMYCKPVSPEEIIDIVKVKVKVRV